MPEFNTYKRTCTICGVGFTTRCTNAKYCDRCRPEVIRINQREKYEKARRMRRMKKTCTEYECMRCGRRIKAYGRCTNRRICDDCLTASGSRKDRAIMIQRKEVREEAIG